MKHNPLNPDFLHYYHTYFNFVKADIDILESFYDALSFLVTDYCYIDYEGELKKIIKKAAFKTMDEANDFLEKYTNFKNEAIGFIEKIESIENHKKHDNVIASMFDMFVEIYRKDYGRLAQILIEKNSMIMNIIFNDYNLSIKMKFNTLIEKMHSFFGENITKNITLLISIIDEANTKKEHVNYENLYTFFYCSITLIVLLNFHREVEFSKKMNQQKSQRNREKNK